MPASPRRSWSVRAVRGMIVASAMLLAIAAPAQAGPRETHQSFVASSAAIPDPAEFIARERHEAEASHPELELWAHPPEANALELQLVTYDTAIDRTERIDVRRSDSDSRKFKVAISQHNNRADVRLTTFHDPQDLGNQNLLHIIRSYDGDLFNRKTVTVTPMLSPRGGGKPRRYGKGVVLPNWDDFSPGNLVQEPRSVDSLYQHVGRVTVKANRAISNKTLRAGRFWIDVGQSWEARTPPPYYDGKFGEFGNTWRLRGPRFSYSGGRPKPGELLFRPGVYWDN